MENTNIIEEAIEKIKEEYYEKGYKDGARAMQQKNLNSVLSRFGKDGNTHE